jgi:hypothetical protein
MLGLFEELWCNKHLMKNFWVKISVILIAVLIIAGCKKNVIINEKQAILFQVDYVNYAKEYVHNGFIIDNQGRILIYNNPQTWNFPDKDFTLKENQVRENLRYCLNTGKKITKEELGKYASHIKNISLSQVTASKNIATDAGSIEYICYQFQEESGTYKGFLIKTEGDFTRENLNFFAKKVISWLKKINDTLVKK